eukprot:3932398-Rhodomonas_salina.1
MEGRSAAEQELCAAVSACLGRRFASLRDGWVDGVGLCGKRGMFFWICVDGHSRQSRPFYRFGLQQEMKQLSVG